VKLPDLMPHNHHPRKDHQQEQHKHVENSSSTRHIANHPTAPNKDITKAPRVPYSILQQTLQLEEPCFNRVQGSKPPT
jgi:hypothetical protein